jgi:putative ABC transport system substrate-binding protein
VTTTLGAKRLDLLRQLVPTATIVGLLVNPANPTSESQANDVQAATRALGLELVIVNARSEREIEATFSSFVQGRVNAIVLGGDGFFLSRREQLVELAARHAIPVMYYLREYAAAGGLISYGTNMSDAYHLGGLYLGRILKGEKPSELPVQQSVNYELVINLKTAKALGLAVPLTMQATADEIIEAP